MNRWQMAQKFELNDWKNVLNIVEDEWKEIENKFAVLFSKIARESKLSSNSKILDLGCGPTVPARLFKTGKITGIDPLADKLGISKKGYLPHTQILNGKGENIPFKDDTFDFVLCRNVIDHTQDPSKVISEVNRVLKPNAYLFLICYTYSPFITFIKNLSERFQLFYNVGHPFSFTPSSLESLVINKFKIVDRYTIHTGQNSTDYGKAGKPIVDNSIVHKVLIFVNKYLFMTPWFLKEYGFLAVKISSPKNST